MTDGRKEAGRECGRTNGFIVRLPISGHLSPSRIHLRAAEPVPRAKRSILISVMCHNRHRASGRTSDDQPNPTLGIRRTNEGPLASHSGVGIRCSQRQVLGQASEERRGVLVA